MEPFVKFDPDKFIRYSDEEIDSREHGRREEIWRNSSSTAPDVFAEDMKLSKYNNWPVWMIQRAKFDPIELKAATDPAKARQLAKANVEMPDWAAMEKDHPSTYGYLGLDDSIALSRDDIENLEKTEDVVRVGIPRLWDALEAGWDEVGTMQRYSDLSFRLRHGDTLTPEENEELNMLGQRLDQGFEVPGLAAVKGVSSLARQFLKPTAETAVNLMPTLIAAGLAMSATAATGGAALPALLAGATTGGAAMSVPAIFSGIARTSLTTQMAQDMMKQEAELAYRDMMTMTDESGVPLSESVGEETIGMIADVAGTASGLLEIFPAEYFAKYIPGIKDLGARQALRSIMSIPTTRQALVSFAKNYVGGLATEAGTEALQRGVTMAGEEYVKEMAQAAGIDVDQADMGEWATALGDEFLQAAKSFSIAMAVGPGIQLRTDINRANKAQAMQEVFMELSGLMSESKTVQRAPEAAQKFISDMTKEGPTAFTYIDAEKFNTYFQEAGLSASEAAEMLGVSQEELESSVESGGKLQIDTATYATRFAGTEAGQALINDVTFDAQGMTMNEAQAFESDRQELERRDKEAAERMLAVQQELDVQASYVRDQVLTMSVGAGVETEVAEANADLWAARATTIADRYGIDPKAWFDRQNLGIADMASRPDLEKQLKDKGVISEYGARGLTTFGDGRVVISLFGQANRSTLMHESSHVFMEDFISLADESDLAMKDLQSVYKWLEIEDFRTLSREQREVAQEKFARTFEAYLLDGKAPSEGLRRVFRTFREWLTSIYSSIMGISFEAGTTIELSDEARDVFNRLLATDAEIEAAANMAEYESALEVTDASLGKHQEALDVAREENTNVPTKAQLRERRKDLSGKVRAELEKSRGYMALSDMKRSAPKGGIKINEADILDNYGDTYLANVVAPLGITSKTSTWQLEDVATRFGYDSGQEMVAELTSLAPLNEAVKTQVDSIMATEESAERLEADAAIRNDSRLEALAIESNNLETALEGIEEAEAPEWAALYDRMKAEADDPISRARISAEIRRFGKISYSALSDLWGVEEAKTLRDHVGPGMFSRDGLGLDVLTEELKAGGYPVRDPQEVYDILMRPKEDKQEIDVSVDAESLPWLVYLMGYQDAAKYLKKRSGRVNRELKDATKEFESTRSDVSRERRIVAQKELIYIKGALKVLTRAEKRLEAEVDPDAEYKVDFDPETFEVVPGKVEWQQPTVQEALKDRAELTLADDPVAIDDAWALASRISRISFREGMKEAQKRAVDTRKKMRLAVREARAERQRVRRELSQNAKRKVDAAKSAAETSISSKAVRELNPSPYLAAERKAKLAVEKAIEQNNFEEASRQKDIQLVNAALANAAGRARKESKKIEKYLKKMSKRKPKKGAAIHIDYMDKIHALLDGLYFGSRRASVEREIDSFLEWKREQEDQGEVVVIPDRLVAKMGQTNARDMTMDNLRELNDSIRNLEHLGRMKNKLITSARKRKLSEAIEDMSTSMQKNAGKPITEDPTKLNESKADKLMGTIRGYFALHKRMEFLFRQLDGFKDMGVMWENIFKPFVDAQNEETVMTEQADAELSRLFNSIDAKNIQKERYNETLGTKMTRENLLSLALNWGNEGNRNRIMNGFGWSEQQVLAALDELSNAELKFVQGVWKFIDSFWPKIRKLERDVAGVDSKKVEATSFELPSGRAMEGGYYPIAYDYSKNEKAFKAEEKRRTEDFMANQFYRAATKQGHTKQRAQDVQGMPLNLHLSVISRHVSDVVHDLSHRMALRDVTRLIESKEVQAGIIQYAGREVYRQLKPWMQNIAAGYSAGPMNAFERIMAHHRRGATVASLGMKVTTALMQPLSFFGAATRIGNVGAVHAFLDFYDNPLAWKKKREFVLERSPEVRKRTQTWSRDVNETIKDHMGVGKHGKLVTSFFYFAGIMDQAAVVPIWLESYDQKLKETGNEQTASYYADSVVRQTQPASNAKDLPGIMRQGELMKMFTMFYSYMSVLQNLLAESMKEVGKTRNVPKFVGDMLALVVVPAILAPLVTGRGPDDDEDFGAWMFKTVATYPLKTLVGVRDLVSFVENPVFGFNATPATRPMESIGNLGIQAAQAIHATAVGDPFAGEEWLDLIDPAIETLGYELHMPVQQAQITIGQVYRYAVGDESEFALRDLFFRRRR